MVRSPINRTLFSPSIVFTTHEHQPTHRMTKTTWNTSNWTLGMIIYHGFSKNMCCKLLIQYNYTKIKQRTNSDNNYFVLFSSIICHKLKMGTHISLTSVLNLFMYLVFKKVQGNFSPVRNITT